MSTNNIYFGGEIRNKKLNGYVSTACCVKIRSYMYRLNIVQPSMKSRSRSLMVDGSGQGASWQMCV